MSDISYNITLNAQKGYLASNVQAGGVTATMNEAGLKSDTYTLSTSASSISTANLSSVGLAFMRNLSTATQATVQIGIEVGGSFVGFSTLRAGEASLFRLVAGTPYQARGTASGRVRVDITEG
jgi:DNA-binding IclR family transcriptional regulator